MPDLKTCEAEAHSFMIQKQSKDKPRVIFRAAGCMEGDQTPGQDVSK
jgi:hypothetical protein